MALISKRGKKHDKDIIHTTVIFICLRVSVSSTSIDGWERVRRKAYSTCNTVRSVLMIWGQIVFCYTLDFKMETSLS